MIKAVLFDLDGTLLDAEKLIAGVGDMLAELNRLGISYAVLTNKTAARARRILRGVNLAQVPVFGKDEVGADKQSGGLHRAALSHFKIAARDAISVGDTKPDSIGAIQAKVLPFGAAWNGNPPPPYAVPARRPSDLVRGIRSCLLMEPRWFWLLDAKDPVGRRVRMRALLKGGDLWKPSMYALLKATLKEDKSPREGSANFRSFLFLYMLSTMYLDGLVQDADFWCLYPPSSSATSRRGVGAFSQPITKLFRKQHCEDLIVRHTAAPKSASLRAAAFRTGSGARPSFDSQIQTIHLTSDPYRRNLPGRSVLLLDDFITEGHSTEAGRNYLLQGGSSDVIAAAFGRFGSAHILLRAPREHFDPWKPNPSLSEADFTRKPAAGTFDPEALDQFLSQWALYKTLC